MPESSANIASFSQTIQTCDQPDVSDSSLYHVSTSTSASSCNKSTQIYSQSVSVGVGVVMPEITIENIKCSIEMIMFYTGLPDFKTFQALFDTLIEHGADKFCTESVGEMNIASLGRKRKLRSVDEFLLVLMRLRLGLLFKDLEFALKSPQVQYQRFLIHGFCLCASVCNQSLLYQN